MNRDTTQKERFEKVLNKANLSYQELLIRILRQADYSNPYETAKKEKSNFSKMVSGERPFKADYIAPLERILNTSLKYIVYGGEEENNDFPLKGIRYAAYKNDIIYFKELENEKNNIDQPVIASNDEFGKSILDYIVQYHSFNGLKYLIDKEYLKLSWNGRLLDVGSNSRIVWSVTAMDVFDMILKNDDAVIFEKFSDPWSRINAYGFSFGLLTSDVTLEKIYKSNNIFDSLLNKREMTLSSINKGLVSNQDRSTYFCNPLTYHLLNYGLLNYERHSDKVIKLLKFGIDYNRWFYKFLKEEFPDEDRFTLS